MTDQKAATEHLRTIRSMMERATIYRAISGPAALFGGAVALGTGIYMAVVALGDNPQHLEPRHFYLIWIGVLALTAIFNTTLIWSGSKRRGEVFFSAGFKLALRAILPPMLAGGISTFILLESGGSRTHCALLWVVFYSLALLASANFAPRSMLILGRTFFVVGLGALIGLHLYDSRPGVAFMDDQALAGIIMALTFGAMHVLYATAILIKMGRPESVSTA